MTDEAGAREPEIRITVSPAPSDEEAAAIVAAVTVLMTAQGGHARPGRAVEGCWKVAGRLEALRSTDWPPLRPGERW